MTRDERHALVRARAGQPRIAGLVGHLCTAMRALHDCDSDQAQVEPDPAPACWSVGAYGDVEEALKQVLEHVLVDDEFCEAGDPYAETFLAWLRSDPGPNEPHELGRVVLPLIIDAFLKTKEI